MSKAKSLGFSPDRLQRIDRFLADKYVGPGRMPHAQFLLARGGEIVHQSVLGMQDPERGVPLAEDSVYRIYSMTKPVTSVALMSLVEEGLIALDDPVSRHIPEWKDLAVFSAGTGPYLTTPPSRPMQVVDLLRHTSGLTYGFQNRTNVDAAYRKLKLEGQHGEHDLEAMIHMMAKIPLEFSPGEAWNYSVSTDVCGYLVQKIAGKPLDQVFQERIFGPLKMVDTGFHVRDDQRARFAACYEATPTGGLKLQDDPTTSPYLAPPALLSGGGGLVSTAADYMRFSNMLMNRGEWDDARILAPKTVDLMVSNHLPGGADLTEMSRSLFSESTNAGVGFGLGFAVVFDPPQTLVPCSLGEFYWGGAASTAFWVDPMEDITAVFMTQLLPSSAYPIRRELRTLVYSALTEPNG
ncbi:MAG: beta-lactamase family protein [Alphaproteobacteria bacterium]|nr:beta-lactamase family protein [Alphaproteobacteria bacterium]MBU1514191.1 beta-lactamase family protein [Alphaproteobacteria bacterium]MBU2096160.1 beta-lactamase family protein [Alphaproteobacteria bacterium]MBU2151114.1 beta-lactamase family protein [Alphaproteobacteria bacterium]MBU2307227.1 beta-lactamase family protein [Alphaproteobacteria bacterium]